MIIYFIYLFQYSSKGWLVIVYQNWEGILISSIFKKNFPMMGVFLIKILLWKKVWNFNM
jgi:hypothetical protein